MTQAVLEILGMLLGALLIGVFFTNRYWKSKYRAKEEEIEKLVSKVANLANQTKELTAAVEEQKTEYEQKLSGQKEGFEKELNELKTKSKEENELFRQDNEQALLEVKKEKAKLEQEVKKEKKETKQLLSTKKELELLIQQKDEELGEKERELLAVDGHFKTHKISYYKQINGKRYKAAILADADEAVAGKGDGRISKSDAEKIFSHVSDGSQYTKVEKDTMHYIRENYNWTPEADAMFRTKVRSWAAKGHHLD